MTEEEIQMVLLAGNKQGIIDSDETEMIQNIFEFDDIPVSQVCTHRIKVTALYTEDSMEELGPDHPGKLPYLLSCLPGKPG